MTTMLFWLVISGVALAPSPGVIVSESVGIDSFRRSSGDNDLPLPAIESLNCRRVGGWPFATSFSVAANTERPVAYVGSGGGIYVVDVSDPVRPFIVTDTIRTYGVAWGIFYQADRLYVADGWAGLEIWSVGPSAPPSLIGRANLPGQAYSVFVADTLAFVTDLDGVLRIVNVLDPTRPVEIGNAALRSRAWDVCVSGTHAYVAEFEYGLAIVDISQPTSPVVEAELALHVEHCAVAVRDTWAFVANFGILSVVNVANSSAPFEALCFYLDDIACDVALVGDTAYLTGDLGLAIYDVSDPLNPIPIGHDDSLGANCFAVSGDIVHLAGDDYRIADISQPSTPHVLSTVAMPGIGFGLCVKDSLACVTNGNDGLQLVDVSEPTYPRARGRCLTTFASCVCINGEQAYVAGDDGLDVVDISNPDTPAVVGHARGALGLAALGTNLYAVGTGGLVVYDISNPAEPAAVGSYSLPGIGRDIQVRLPYAFIADDMHGLEIVDVSDPANPRYSGRAPCGTAWGVDVCGTKAYVADVGHAGGLHVVDVADPSSPRWLGRLIIEGYANDVSAAYPYAYVASAQWLSIADVSDPVHPNEVGYYQSPAWIWGVAAARNVVFTNSSQAGMQVYESPLIAVGSYDIGSRPRVQMRAVPSPAHRQTSVTVTGLDAEAPALDLFDASGRLVLQSRVTGPTARLSIDHLRPGTYFVRTHTQRASLVVTR